MKLRFKVDQAELFRRGIDCPKSIVTVDVNPAEIKPEIRELIAQRMDGIDVKSIELEYDSHSDKPEVSRDELIIVQGTSLDDLIAAVTQEHAALEAEVKNHTEEEARKRALAQELELEIEMQRRAQKPPATLKPQYGMPN